MINIVSKKKKVNILEDGINALLKLDDSDFIQIIEKLDVEENSKLEKFRFSYSTDGKNTKSGIDFSEKSPTMSEIFIALREKLNGYSKNSKEYKRIIEILNKRNIEQFKRFYTTDENEQYIDNLFELLTNNEKYRIFMDSENNKTEIKEYMKLLGNIFGHKRSSGTFSKIAYIANNFYLPQLNGILNKVDEIYKKYNLDRYTLPEYEFEDLSNREIFEEVIREEDEPEWNISQELQNEILNKMPGNLSLEEKAMYIYIKLCSTLKYNEDYLYKDNVNLYKFSHDFNQEKLESIRPRFKSYMF